MRSEEEIRKRLKDTYFERGRAEDAPSREWVAYCDNAIALLKWVLNDKGDSLKDGEKP
jgi:NAD+--asparagine ADP-ribosyltransferase